MNASKYSIRRVAYAGEIMYEIQQRMTKQKSRVIRRVRTKSEANKILRELVNKS